MRDPIDPPYTIGYGFGYRGDIGVPGASTDHQGIDIAVGVGTPVYAPLAGRVVQVTATGAAGYSIVLQHDATTRTRFNHLEKIPSYAAGARVKEGEQIATSGGKRNAPGAGTSGGPHLHFAVYKLRNGLWIAVDPVPWLAAGRAAAQDSKPFAPEREEEDDMGYAFMTDEKKPYYWFSFARGKSRKLSTEEVVQMRSAERSGIPGNEIHKVAAGWYANQLKLGTFEP